MQQPSPKLRLIALVLVFLFGGFGVHRMYCGKVGTGIAQFLLTISIIGLLVNIVWVFIDLLMIATGAFEDKEGRPLTVWTR